MKYALILSLLITGCSTVVPVTQKFPEVPGAIIAKCDDLIKLNNDAKLSDVAETVTVNYSMYYKCSAKHDEFVEWYNNQKKIYESIN